MWWKLLLLGIYLLLVLVVTRVLESVVWCADEGKSILAASVIMDPLTLSVRTLKQILEHRGVSYRGILEKHELYDLVESSGQTTESEIAELEGNCGEEDKKEKQTTHFTCGSHFYEEVEDKKDSIWLVQVISADGVSIMSDSVWQELTSKLHRFDVRTGILDCNLDRRMCSRRGWHASRIMLALPGSSLSKQDVILHQYTAFSKLKTQHIVNWIRMHLAQRVTSISSVAEFKTDWLSYKDAEKKSVVRVVLVSSALSEPPLFMSALSVKFSGRAKFGIINSKNSSLKSVLNSEKLPVYLVITPERVNFFGQRQGEILSYKSLELFLRSLTPEMNDIFQVSVILVNMVTVLELFLVRGKFWKHIVRSTWNIARDNSLLFLLWLLVLTLLRFSFMTTVSECCLTLVRTIGSSDVASLVRDEWRDIQKHPFYLGSSFTLFCVVSGVIWAKLKPQGSSDEPLELFDWLTGPIDSYIMNCFFRPMATLTRPMVPQDLDLEEGMELLIERLAVPNLWLQPMISNEYIKDLPTWRYTGWNSDDEFLSSSEMSSDDDFHSIPKNISPGYSLADYLPKIQQNTLLGDIIDKSKSILTGRLGNQAPYTPKERAPNGALECRDCSICLEKYKYCVELCCLPCGHSYHVNCILMWLSRDNHCCPVCRWPSYKPKFVSSVT